MVVVCVPGVECKDMTVMGAEDGTVGGVMMVMIAVVVVVVM